MEKLEDILRCPDCSGSFKNNDNTLFCCDCCRIVNPYNSQQVSGVIDIFPRKQTYKVPKFYNDEDYRSYIRHLVDMHDKMYNEGILTRRLEYAFKNALKKIVKPIQKGTTVVDIGCGTGTSFSLCGEDTNIIGVDSNINLLKIAKEKYPESVLLHADMYNSPFKDGKFKVIFCVSTLEHIFYLEQFLLSINNMLDEEGYFYVLIPTEGGFAWNIGRMILTSWKFSKKYGYNYSNAVKKEHCNKALTIDNALRKFFIVDEFRSWPFPIGGVHANAIFLYRLKK